MVTSYSRFTKKTACLFYLAFVCGILLNACHKEESLSPSPDGANIFYRLPQGNHSYDPSIVQFYQDYNSVILYKFDSVDYNYNTTGAENPLLFINAADTGAVANALDFIRVNWLNLYPEEFLQKTLPFKILLASKISIGRLLGNEIVSYAYYSASVGMNYVCFGLANDSLQSLSGSQMDSTRGMLQRAFWQQALRNATMERPEGFDMLTKYANVNSFNLKQYGCFFNHRNNRGTNNATQDFLDYIQIITSTDSTTMKNTWLSPATDINGMYTTKYNLITHYYLTKYGVDLQAIGDLKNQ